MNNEKKIPTPLLAFLEKKEKKVFIFYLLPNLAGCSTSCYLVDELVYVDDTWMIFLPLKWYNIILYPDIEKKSIK